MSITLDQPSLDLLGALHLGCHARIVDRDDGSLWEVRHRVFAQVNSAIGIASKRPPRTSDVTYTGRDRVLPGTIARVDKWTGPEREHDLRDGLRLIRAGLAVRSGEALELTEAGYGVGTARYGEGLTFGYASDPQIPEASTPPAFDLADDAGPIDPYPRIAADAELHIEREEHSRQLILRVSSGTKKLVTYQPFGSARTIIAMLGDAGKSGVPVEADFGENLIVTVHDKDHPANLRIEGEWDHADVPLPAPLHRLLREYIRENVKGDGAGMVMRPVDVVWRSFDATWDEILD